MSFIKTNVANIGDPFILREDNGYYMYATSDATGFRVFYSEDLTEWKDLGLCYNGLEGWGYMDFWAPEVVKHGGRYIMYFTAKDKKTDSLRTGVAVADRPEGLFKDTGKPMFDFGYATIDASAFTDDDGKSYLYYVKDCSQNIVGGVRTSQIFAAEMNEDMLSLKGEGKLIATPDCDWEMHPDWQWNEAPSVVKHKGKYYLTYSVNCFDSLYYSVGYAVSDHPMGKFVKAAENPVLKYRENVISGPGHNSFFIDKQKKLRAAFHIHTHYDKPSGNRTACICDAAFTDDGKLKFIL